MRKVLTFLILFCGLASSMAQEAPVAPPADPAVVSGYGVAVDDLLVQARQRAIRLAGAFANDGYKLRDGAWSLNLTPGKPHVLAVFLFAGNEMWFSAAGANVESRPQLELFNSNGAPVNAKTFQHDGLAALGLVVPHTGMFYLRAFTTADATAFALVTSYK